MDDNGARPRKALRRHLPDLFFPMDSPSEMSESQEASSSNASECTNATEATIHTDAERLQARGLPVFARTVTISDDDGDGHDEGKDGVGNEYEDEPLTSREQLYISDKPISLKNYKYTKTPAMVLKLEWHYNQKKGINLSLEWARYNDIYVLQRRL